MSLDKNRIITPWYTGFSTVPPQTISSENYPYVLRDNSEMFSQGINYQNWNPYITHSGNEVVDPAIDHGCGEYPSSLIWQFGAGLLIVFISVAGAIISYSFGSKIGFLIATGSLSIGAFIVALTLLNGQDIDGSRKL